MQKELLLNNGSTLILREAVRDDAQNMIDHMQIVTAETDFLTFGAGEFSMTLEDEKELIQKTVDSTHEIFLLAILNGEVIGIGGIHGSDIARIQHIGNLGLSIRKEFWGLGIGSLMMQTMIDWARETTIIRKIELFVVTDNTTAITLYEKFGFEREGYVRRNMYIRGAFYDSYYMGMLID